MLTITIPTPCHEDWNKMTPDETGRHCSSCAKSVVDFTGMSDEEVKYFFLSKKEEERVCGRFKQTQLHRIVIELPQNIFSMQMPLWKKFLAACLISFSTTLFSCETKIKGMAVHDVKMGKTTQSDDTGMVRISSIQDTLSICTTTVGNIMMPVLLKGDVEVIETDTLTVPVPQENESPFIRDTTYLELQLERFKINDTVTPTKTKNPPAADSINCKTIKNYH